MLRLNKILIVVLVSVSFLGWVGEVKAQDAEKPVVCNLSTTNDDRGQPLKNDSWFLPDCVYFEGTSVQRDCGCRNINVFVQLLINAANKILMVVGGVALIMFIYGGFVILTAAGGDNVKKGKETLVAAVIGLVIIFSAQLLLNFVLKIVVEQAPVKPSAKVEGVQINVPEVKPK
ncbi:MAG: pilin [Candidatus Magasanikbacteria bacterium]|nr:pilin [Candidatus Magasanikbacteria bacterium]